jgi:hypothetical protein
MRTGEHPRPRTKAKSRVRRRTALFGGAGALLLTVVRPDVAIAQATEGDPGSHLPFNGFKVDRASIREDSIQRGGPPRDGIPSIDRPRFVPAGKAGLAPEDRVLGVLHRGVSRAYPVRILNWHEIDNDRIAGDPVAITYCPLCGSGVVFSSVVAGRELSFGVSGLLYESDMLLYDRQTESLWSQLKYQAVTGPMLGAKPARLPVEHTTWQDWRARHPRTEVLSFDTGHARDYGRDPYAGYDRDPAIFFPVSRTDARLDPKAWVLGIERNGLHKAYPLDKLGVASGRLQDAVGGEAVTIHFDARHRTARALDAQGRDIPTVIAFWFAWAAFNPGTELHGAPASGR